MWVLQLLENLIMEHKQAVVLTKTRILCKQRHLCICRLCNCRPHILDEPRCPRFVTLRKEDVERLVLIKNFLNNFMKYYSTK